MVVRKQAGLAAMSLVAGCGKAYQKDRAKHFPHHSLICLQSLRVYFVEHKGGLQWCSQNKATLDTHEGVQRVCRSAAGAQVFEPKRVNCSDC